MSVVSLIQYNNLQQNRLPLLGMKSLCSYLKVAQLLSVMACTLNQRLFIISLLQKASAGHQFIISIFVAHESLLLRVNVPHFNEIVLMISSPRVLRMKY